MLVIGTVKCLHCGFEDGRWAGEQGAALTVIGLRGVHRQSSADPAALLRCGRCEGPVFLDDASLVMNHRRLRRIRRLRGQIALFDADRAA